MPPRKVWLPYTIIICIAVIGFAWRPPSAKKITPFKDLNKNGKLDVYQDSNLYIHGATVSSRRS